MSRSTDPLPIDGDLLFCPVCGDRNTHLMATAATRLGVPGGRLDAELEFTCEAEPEPHVWLLTFHQNRGTTTVEWTEA